MGLESIIFAKNRHMFGGMEPPQMESLSVTIRRMENTSLARLKIRAVLPDDATVTSSDGTVQTVCSVSGAVIRRRTDTYPVDEFDGEEIANITESRVIEDIYPLEEDIVTYYYRAFVYSDQGVYNRSFDIGKSALPVNSDPETTPIYIFGYDLDTADSNPATRVTYPSDVDNVDYNKAYMDFNNDTFNYGDWNIDPGKMFMPNPCMLKYDGTVGEYLDPNDYSLTIEGTTSNIANQEYEGNAMMEWPKIYTKRWEDEDGIYHFRCSDISLDSSYDCWCNYDINDNVIDHFYTPIYLGSSDGTRLRSLSGFTGIDNIAVNTSMNMAEANGADAWCIEVLADRLLIQDLLVLISRNTNTQAVYGNGNGGPTHIIAGSLNQKGLFWGATSFTDGVKVFGMENWWGDYGRWTAGMVAAYRHRLNVKITSGTHDGTTNRGYQHDPRTDYYNSKNYIAHDNEWFGEGTSYGVNYGSGYISAMSTYPWGRLPYKTADKGSSSTYEADVITSEGSYSGNAAHYIYFLVNTDRYQIDGIGSNRKQNGAFTYIMSTFGHFTEDRLGAALSCKPLLITE